MSDVATPPCARRLLDMPDSQSPFHILAALAGAQSREKCPSRLNTVFDGHNDKMEEETIK